VDRGGDYSPYVLTLDARLVDYRMHDGRNAWAPVHVRVTAATSLPAGTALFTRIDVPLPGQTAPPGTVIPAGAIGADALERDPRLARVVAFETAHDVRLFPEANELRIHGWGEEDCCLEAGTTEAYVYAVPDPATGAVVRPPLGAGDRLVLEEVLGPRTGAPPDADREHRALVQLEAVDADATDPLFSDTLTPEGALVPRVAGAPPLPLVRVQWRRSDALQAPFAPCAARCLTAIKP
jgi:hypothetical protein